MDTAKYPSKQTSLEKWIDYKIGHCVMIHGMFRDTKRDEAFNEIKENQSDTKVLTQTKKN